MYLRDSSANSSIKNIQSSFSRKSVSLRRKSGVYKLHLDNDWQPLMLDN